MIRMVFVALLLVLSACGGAPKVRESRVLPDAPSTKVTKIYFFYQDANLTTTTTYGKGSVSLASSGYYSFGQNLVDLAKSALGKHGLSVAHAGMTEPNEWKKQATAFFAGLNNAQRMGGTLMTVSPKKGSASRDSASESVWLLYEVRLADMDTGKLRWVGWVDTTTWIGKNIVTKEAKGATYNAEYANQFFDALTLQMKQDGLI